MKHSILLLSSLLIYTVSLSAQKNVGIDIESPRSKLEVAGKISSTKNGIQFPNGSTQRAAANNNNDIGAEPVFKVYADFSNGIEGEHSSGGYNDHSLIIGIHGQLFRDVSNIGAPGDSLHHRPLVITKNVETATPDVYSHFKNNSVISTVDLKFTRLGSSGQEIQYFEITLNNVKIFEIRQELRYNKDSDIFNFIEHIHMAYQSIEFKNITNGDMVNIPWSY